MSTPNKNISVTVTIDNGIASFSYSPDGNIEVTESTNIVFELSNKCSTAVRFKQPLIAYVPPEAHHDIDTDVSDKGQILTLNDADLNEEQIAVQLVVKDTYGNTYASPDPRIINRPD